MNIWYCNVFDMKQPMEYFVYLSRRSRMYKNLAARPVMTIRPESLVGPQGNTTFLEGTTWCVARPGASQAELQRALDWACGIGRVDCSVIERHGDCYEPDTIVSHASFAFNAYYQTNGNNRIACYFGGTATLTKINPSKYMQFTTSVNCVKTIFI